MARDVRGCGEDSDERTRRLTLLLGVLLVVVVEVVGGEVVGSSCRLVDGHAGVFILLLVLRIAKVRRGSECRGRKAGVSPSSLPTQSPTQNQREYSRLPVLALGSLLAILGHDDALALSGQERSLCVLELDPGES